MKNYKNERQKLPISIILKVEPHGLLQSLQHLSVHRSDKPDVQILIWNIFNDENLEKSYNKKNKKNSNI